MHHFNGVSLFQQCLLGDNLVGDLLHLAQLARFAIRIRLLGELGYRHVLTFEKRRTRYTLDGCRIELDDLPVIGGFVEIEGPSDELVLAARDKLGLGEAPLIKSSYIAMLKTHLHEVGEDTDTIRFENGKSVVRG